MRKSNITFFTIAIIISAFLLWLWYHLGFNHVDSPLDLFLSIIWWILVAVACIVIHKVEKKRQEAIRTTYVGRGVLFNPEKGLVNISARPDTVVDALEELLGQLEYNFDREDLPESLVFECVVRSRKFKPVEPKDEEAPEAAVQATPEEEREEPEWEGEVARAYEPDEDPIPFESRQELAAILESLGL